VHGRFAAMARTGAPSHNRESAPSLPQNWLGHWAVQP
jgi:hypothetical protein